jgi:phenylacetate-coenzyme A ligase PaaK-like adenylate-forming protein
MDVGYQAKRLVDVGRALRAARALAERERWPREGLERHQQQRLDALVRYAVEHSPFYRGRFAGLPATGSVELRALPTLDKGTMMQTSTSSSRTAACAATLCSRTSTDSSTTRSTSVNTGP